ncbi:hypothetical protein [Rhizobium sp. CCGE532]|uniref:hypothetical protein n=1 Tax=Rhizobium sp. CCGE532 TaxID=2364272 RepID=UPI000EA9D84A|nr:hypothetical protein [Rhizobium sp. CCGE532]AYG76923.1 hypothetical protein CCGE532_31045 [Rhizobium sp. CCGE532]
MIFTQADLDIANGHIAESEEQVSRQERKVTVLRMQHLDTELAENILTVFYETLLIHNASRDMIAAQLRQK